MAGTHTTPVNINALTNFFIMNSPKMKVRKIALKHSAQAVPINLLLLIK
jgi:hypothetical protein